MVKKVLNLFFIIVFTFVFVKSLIVWKDIYDFKSKDVKSNIEYLSSDHFKGRLAGTFENHEVTAFVKNQFKQNGLIPFEGDYYDPFDANYPHKLEENPHLKIMDKDGDSIKEYKYGKDYKEEMLNFKKNTVEFTMNENVNEEKNALAVYKDNNSFLFFAPQDNVLTFRSSFMGTQPGYYSMYIMVTNNTLSEIKDYIKNGYKISCYIPFDIKKATLKNVTAYIKGKDSKKPPVVISAHFDHLGIDAGGTVYGGALDNASGISFIMELSKYVKSLGTPNRDIIFAGFNAEEFGCLGSEHFVQKYLKLLKGAKVYNFDMIGSSKVPLSIMGGKNDNNKTEFVRSLNSTLSKEKVNYNFVFEDSSDHEAFRKNNIDAVTFCDSDMSKIHTPEDKASYIDSDAIDRAFNVVSAEIIDEVFKGNFLLVYNKSIMISSGFLCLLSVTLFVIQIKKSSKTKKVSH